MFQRIIDFNKHSSIRIGGIKTVTIIQSIDEILNITNKDYCILGKVNNILISHNAKNLIQLGKEFDYIKDCGNYIEIGAMCNTKKAFLYFKNKNLSGLEFLGSIPGSIGGAIKMNAGMKEFEIKDSIISVLINNKWVDSNDINFKYRHSGIEGIIFAARFIKNANFNNELECIFKKMRLNQPNLPSCGSCFKNPMPNYAGQLLEQAGLRGMRIGDMEFSKKHANFLINTGKGKFEDAISLINLAKEKVLEKFNINLELEIVVMH